MSIKTLVGCAIAAFSLTVSARDSVVFVCAHPDDFAGCSGIGMRLTEKFDVHVIDYTHGERGCGEAGYKDGSTRAKRTIEEENVCKIAGATLHWMEEVDGEATAGMETCKKLASLLKTIKPRAVIAHWPIDKHLDHAMSSVATLKAIKLAGITPEVYFQEQHHQSRNYRASIYVDISSVFDKRAKLIMCYQCQNPKRILASKNADAANFASEVGMKFAETLEPMASTVSLDRCIFTEIPGVMIR